MIYKDVALTLFYVVYYAQDRGGGGGIPFFARATIIWNILEYFDTLNIKIMSSRTQKENPAQWNLFES